MQYAYPIVLTQETNGYYFAEASDLPGIVVGSVSLTEVLQAASDACALWLADAEKNREPIPPASDPSTLSLRANAKAALVLADTDEYRRRNDSHAVKKTLTIPAWMNAMAEDAGLSFSQVLQDALRERLGVAKNP